MAILKEGQYRGSHKIGLHQGKYEALRQKKPLKVLEMVIEMIHTTSLKKMYMRESMVSTFTERLQEKVVNQYKLTSGQQGVK